ncbi:hypothetical protein HNY73_013196 [Argiope bruennichi]|uniref:Uncharacterized protein n=1 Tax=Argiope bruennichi TaxID=94029 RepID=A0A8T0EXA2_ARGBR|nr:hypothetical protein HNY73_013196 [Argiope bruennichi]
MLYLIWLSSHVIALDALLEQSSVPKHAKETIERFKIKLHRTLDEVSMRRRRSLRSDESVHYETPAITSQKIHSPSLPVVAWCVVHLGEEEIPFAATEEEIGMFDTKFFPLVNIPNEERIYSLLGFQYEDDLFLVTIQSAEDEHSFGIHKYSDDESLVLEKVFPLTGESFAMVTEVQQIIYLPILSNNDSDSILNLFVWQEFQFELIVELPLKGNGKSLASWEMYNILFVAVSFNDVLKIFHFSERHERLILTQRIEQNCDIVKHFKDVEIHNLVCSGNKKILLYIWNGDRFSEQQEICDFEPVVDITLMSLSEGNVMMLSVKPNLLEFYFQDSGLYIKSKDAEILEDGVLKNVDVWEKAGVFYLLPVFHDYNGITVMPLDINFPKSSERAFKMSFNAIYFLMKRMKIAQLQDINAYLRCVRELEKVMNDTDDIIKNRDLKHSNIWTKDRSFHIPEVHVKGAVVSNRISKISRISFIDSDSLNAQSISGLINELSTKLRNLQWLLRNAVLKSTDQKIYGNIKFGDQLFISNDLRQFSPRLTFNGGNVKNVETNFLNSVGITDYLLLSKQWEYVKGHLQFKDLSVNNMKVKSNRLNDIPLTDIVTCSSPQNITSLKTFQKLSSTFINTNGNISGVNMNNFKNIILKDTSEFGTMLHFTSDVTFRNLYVHSINGKNLSHLALNSVKHSEDQIIEGIKAFTGSVTIDNIFTSYVNNIKLDDLMTLHTPQTHYNDFEIVDVSFKEIKTHSVNGIDLSKEAIKKTGDFKINDEVSFTQHLVVTDDIILKDGVLLDGIDLSKEVPSLISTKKDIFNDSLDICNIIVKNNVEITDARIKSLLRSLLNDVWLKSKRQYVPYAHFKVMNAKDLNVNSLNGVSFNEIVLCNTQSVINSKKEFADIEVQSLSLQDGRTVNGIDFTSDSLISSFLEKLKSFRVKDMIIKGNLDLPTFNNINIFDLMQVEKFQVCVGSKTFHSIFVNELIASTLDFENIYNRSFSEYIADSVSLRPLEYIFNKKFNFISSEGLDIAGFLNRKKFKDLLESVATLNTYQVISSDIEFINGLEMKSATMKNLNVPNMENIVCKDRVEKNISHKQFQIIYANEADIGYANGVDIAELQKCFLERRNNWVSSKMRFKSGFKTSKIQIISPASIDGVKLDDTFKLNSANNLASMNLSNIHAKNVDVFGKVNGCDLSGVREFLMKNIFVKTKKYFTNLVVDGNLHVKNALNGLDESSFGDIASSLRFMSNMKRSYNLFNVKATQLKVLGAMNGINIDFLLKDAVRPHLPQTIMGRKSFSKITTSNITINKLNVAFLNKLNIPLLYRKYLSKTANQIIALNLPNITAGEVFIEGSLNGVKLPEDVVLVHTNEKISSDVICKEPITSFNMHIREINNTDLQQFLRSIVSLTSNENISSTLIFVRELVSKGDLHIVNSLHGINLNDVVKTSNGFVQNSITGNKIFLEELNLMSDFRISGAINNIDLENLYGNLCQRSKFEYFENMVYFFWAENF